MFDLLKEKIKELGLPEGDFKELPTRSIHYTGQEIYVWREVNLKKENQTGKLIIENIINSFEKLGWNKFISIDERPEEDLINKNIIFISPDKKYRLYTNCHENLNPKLSIFTITLMLIPKDKKLQEYDKE